MCIALERLNVQIKTKLSNKVQHESRMHGELRPGTGFDIKLVRLLVQFILMHSLKNQSRLAVQCADCAVASDYVERCITFRKRIKLPKAIGEGQISMNSLSANDFRAFLGIFS